MCFGGSGRGGEPFFCKLQESKVISKVNLSFQKEGERLVKLVRCDRINLSHIILQVRLGYNTQQYTTTHNNTQHHNNNITTMHNNTQQYATIHDNSQQYTTIHNNTQQYTKIHNNSKQYMTLAFQVKRAKLRILFTYIFFSFC